MNDFSSWREERLFEKIVTTVMTTLPRVFISYSWTSPQFEAWVINLAERLVSDGVNVCIDKWELKEGQDKYSFMESMVQSPEIIRVLMILDKKYAEKADQRSGGVGTETQIISPKIYANVSEEKFIPIIAERDEEGNAYVPTYLAGRIYIDLSNQDNYEENYEHLLRNIYKRPAYSKPKIGKAPSYLFDESPMSHKTSTILRALDNQLARNPQRIDSLIRDFLDEFYQDLGKFTQTLPNGNPIERGKAICDSIQAYTPLRNDFIFFFDKIIKSEITFDVDIILRFLEKLPLLTTPRDHRTNWSSHEFDNFRFFIHETFLYLIATGIKNEAYYFIEELLYSRYLFHERHNYKGEPKTYRELYQFIDSINPYYIDTYSQNFLSPMADLMVKRIPDGFSRNYLIDADLLCFYVAELTHTRWFPITYIYREGERFELFDRLISARHFEKVKSLFGVSSPEEYKTMLIELRDKDTGQQRIGYSGSFDAITPIYRLVDIEKIATTR